MPTWGLLRPRNPREGHLCHAFLWILLSRSGVSAVLRKDHHSWTAPDDTPRPSSSRSRARRTSVAQAQLLALAGEAEHAPSPSLPGSTHRASAWAWALPSTSPWGHRWRVVRRRTDDRSGSKHPHRRRRLQGPYPIPSLVSIGGRARVLGRRGDATLSGSTVNIVRSSGPPKPGERRRPARGGKRFRLAYIASISRTARPRAH